MWARHHCRGWGVCRGRDKPGVWRQMTGFKSLPRDFSALQSRARPSAFPASVSASVKWVYLPSRRGCWDNSMRTQIGKGHLLHKTLCSRIYCYSVKIHSWEDIWGHEQQLKARNTVFAHGQLFPLQSPPPPPPRGGGLRKFPSPVGHGQ